MDSRHRFPTISYRLGQALSLVSPYNRGVANACGVCGARSQLYLCRACGNELTDIFHGMFVRHLVDYRTGRSVRGPGYFELLSDAAQNRTRLGDGGRRRYSAGRLVTYTDERPAATGTGMEGQRIFEQDLDAGKMALRCVLTEGRVNSRAVELHTRARATVVYWCSKVNGSFAGLPEAKVCFEQMQTLIKDIERCINRPVEPVAVGPCPTLVAPDRECGWALEAHPGDVEVTCQSCRMTYNVERLRSAHLASIGHRRYTRRDLLTLMARIGEPVASSTMHDWIRTERLKCRGYQRPTAPGKLPRFGLTKQSDADKPVYRLEDARKLRNKS